MKRKLKENINKYIIFMFILIIIAEILLRVNNKLLNIYGLIFFPIIVIAGIVLLIKDKKKSK